MDSEKLLAYSTRQSPGDGITQALLSREPLATEGEATPGPDDVNPFLENYDNDEEAVESGSGGSGELDFGFEPFGERRDDDDGMSFGFDF